MLNGKAHATEWLQLHYYLKYGQLSRDYWQIDGKEANTTYELAPPNENEKLKGLINLYYALQTLIDCEWYEKINPFINNEDYWYGGDPIISMNEITYNAVKKFYDENEHGLLQLGYRHEGGGHAVLITGAPEELDINFYRERGYEFYPNNYYGYRIPIYDVNCYDQRYMYIKNDFSSVAFGDNEHITTVFSKTAEGDEQEYEDIEIEVNKIDYSKILNFEEIIKNNGKIKIGSAKTYVILGAHKLFKVTNEDGEYVVTDGINVSDGSLECKISTKLGDTPDQQNKNISKSNVVLDGGSNYSVETVNDTDALDISILTSDSYMSAKTTAGGKATFENKKSVTLENPTAGEYETKLTLNEEYVKLPYYTITTKGTGATQIKTEMTEQGAVISGDDLGNLVVTGNNTNDSVDLEINTNKDEVLIKSNATQNGLEAYVDNDGNGTYETKIGEVQQTKLGDVSGNGDIDPNDYIAILRHIAAQTDTTKQKWILSEEKQAIADVTKDGKIDINDVMKLRRYIAAKNDENVASAHPSWLEL